MPLTVHVTEEDIRKGKRLSSTSCPIAQAILREYGPRSVGVNYYHIVLHNKVTPTNNPQVVVVELEKSTYYRPTLESQIFIESFDSGLKVQPTTFVFEETA